MTKRAAVYCRVSTDDQRDNYSIPSQLAGCFQYAEAKGYTIVGNQFVDPDTGRDVAPSTNGAVKAYVDDYTSRELSRPALDAALDYLETVGFDFLIVYSLDRLARDPYIRETLEREFKRHDAKVVFALGDYDDSAHGEVRKDLDATFAKWENVTRVERCNRGKKRKAESGLFVAGRAPYGYVMDGEALGGLRVVEEQAAVVRHTFQLYADEGLSIHGVRRTLTEEGARTAHGKKKWANSSIRRILGNTVYIGYAFYNKHRRNGKGLEQKDRDEWIRYETTPIVEKWLFDEAQRRLEENAKMKRRQPSRFYLLGGMVICAVCERPYLSQTLRAGKNRRRNDAQSYRHRARQGHCRNHQISARLLEPLVWEKITEVLMDPERLRKGYEGSLAQQEATATRKRAHLETLHRRVKSIEEMRRNLTTAYLDPEIKMTKAEYIEQKEHIDSEGAELNRDVEQVEKELASIPTPAELETLETFAASIREIISGEDVLSPKMKREVLELLHVKVVIDKDADVFRVEGWFGQPAEGLLSKTS